MANKDLKLAIGWNRINLEILGIWPEPSDTNNLSSAYRFLIPAILVGGFICLPQGLALYFVWDNVSVFCEILSTAWLPCTNALVKLLVVRYRRKALRSLLQSFYYDWNNNYPKDAHEIMLDGARRAKTISMWCTIVTQTMVTLFILMRTVQIIGTDRNIDDQIHLLIYKGHVPLDMTSTPILVLSNIGQIVSAVCSTISYTGVDSFVCMLVIHVCTQFSTLELRLNNLFGRICLLQSANAFRKELGFIVKRHEHLIWYANTLEECFNFFLLFQMLLCTLQICIQSFQVLAIFQSGAGSFLVYLFYLFLIAFIVSHIFLYCYMGEMLLNQNGKMANSAYNTEWYNAGSDEAKTIMILACRSTIPLRFTAGKFGTFSMEMFSTILRTAMGYLSVLLTVSNSDD